MASSKQQKKEFEFTDNGIMRKVSSAPTLAGTAAKDTREGMMRKHKNNSHSARHITKSPVSRVKLDRPAKTTKNEAFAISITSGFSDYCGHNSPVRRQTSSETRNVQPISISARNSTATRGQIRSPRRNKCSSTGTYSPRGQTTRSRAMPSSSSSSVTRLDRPKKDEPIVDINAIDPLTMEELIRRQAKLMDTLVAIVNSGTKYQSTKQKREGKYANI